MGIENQKMKTAFLDCFSGISGDMFLGALLDAGLPLKELKQGLQTLPVGNYRLEMNRETRNGVSGTRVIVKYERDAHVQRDLGSILEIIRKGDLSESVKKKSSKVFERIARVEGMIHNLPPGEVHFHEVGAVDSIIDIVGSIFGTEYLGINSIAVSALPLGSGFMETDHGMLPIPSPATIALLKEVPVFDSGIRHEMVTPTGAALVTALADSFGKMPAMAVETVGYGVGSRELPDRPNLLRILIGDRQADRETDSVVVLDTNLDDTSPEWMGYLMERLFKAGALDVAFFPVQMKKNRPGVQIQVMGRPDQRDNLMEIIFRESGALGVRYRYSRRKVLIRTTTEVESPWGKIMVKKALMRDNSPRFLPEYEACMEIALKNNQPLREIYAWVMGLNRKI